MNTTPTHGRYFTATVRYPCLDADERILLGQATTCSICTDTLGGTLDADGVCDGCGHHAFG